MTLIPRRRQPRRKAKQHLSHSSIYHRTVQGATASSNLDHQTNTSRTGPRLCARCQHIDFRAIFTTQKGVIPSDEGRFIMYLDQLLHDPSCRACNFFEKMACSDPDASLYHLRVFSVESLFEVKKATTSKPRPVALAVLPGKE
jgi:hypothetical protein